jgi:hypothetical protein
VAGKHTATGREVRGSASFFETIEDIADTLDEIGDYLAQLSPALQERLVRKLVKEGVTGVRAGGLLGTTEARAAKAVTDPLAQVPEWLAWCTGALKKSALEMHKNVLDPIEIARAERSGDDPFDVDR